MSVWILLMILCLSLGMGCYVAEREQRRRDAATLLSPLEDVPDAFTVAALPPMDQPAPSIEPGLLAGLDRSEAVRLHLEYLGTRQRQIAQHYAVCVSAFQTVRSHVIAQRHHLCVTAQEVVRRTAGASALLARRRAIKPAVPVTVPRMPRFQTQADFDKKFKRIANGAALNIAQLIHSDLGISGKAAVVVGMAAYSVVAYQKSVRQMFEADGQLHRFRREIAQQLEIFARAYPELVTRSRDIHALELDIRACLDGTTDETWVRYAAGTCAPTERALADGLLSHAMHANIYMAIAD